MTKQITPMAALGSAMLGVVKANGWVEMPITVDVNGSLELLKELGGIQCTRAEAVYNAMQMMMHIGEIFGLPVNIDSEDAQLVRILLGQAYDMIAVDL